MSNLLNAFYNSQNQIIDVTKECTFEWYQDPVSCCAFLEVSGASGDFTEGETVTGGTSNATATVFSSYVGGGRVYVTDVSGTFQADETITGSSSNQTATVDGFVAERSWPDNITHGTFPDSIISKDIDNYLEWESSLDGAGFSGYFDISFPETAIYSFCWITGVGLKIDSYNITRYTKWRVYPTLSEVYNSGRTTTSDFDGIIGNSMTPSLLLLTKDQKLRVLFYQVNKGTFRWRIHNIRVLKLVI